MIDGVRPFGFLFRSSSNLACKVELMTGLFAADCVLEAWVTLFGVLGLTKPPLILAIEDPDFSFVAAP